MGNRRGGLFFGVIMGTILGVLFAPRKGKELRKDLKEEVQKGGLGTETLKKNLVAMGKEMAATAETVYQQPVIKKHVNEGKKRIYKFVDEAEKKLTGYTGFKKKPIRSAAAAAGKKNKRHKTVKIKKK